MSKVLPNKKSQPEQSSGVFFKPQNCVTNSQQAAAYRRSLSNQRFYLFTGKGGTGKTTLSAAASVYFAEKGKSTLIASIDPAHSLSDCFGIPLSSEPTKITKNLYGVEIDAAKALKRNRFLITHLHRILKSLGIHDTDVLETLPGIDEVMAYDLLVEFIENRNDDYIVLDTAPSGHALRFLSIPHHMDDWLKKSFRMGRQVYGLLSFAKKTNLAGPSYKEEHQERDRMSKIYYLLMNKKCSSISLVLLPEKLSIAETERDLRTLTDYGLPVKELIINRIFPRGNDTFLKKRWSIQQENIAVIKKKFSRLQIKEIPYLEQEVIGIPELKKINKYYFTGGDNHVH